MLNWRILTGDVRETLKALPEQCVQTCVTSPPYFRPKAKGCVDGLGARRSLMTLCGMIEPRDVPEYVMNPLKPLVPLTDLAICRGFAQNTRLGGSFLGSVCLFWAASRARTELLCAHTADALSSSGCSPESTNYSRQFSGGLNERRGDKR